MVFGGVLGLTIALQSFNPRSSILNASLLHAGNVRYIVRVAISDRRSVKTGRSSFLAGLCLCSALLAAIAMCGPYDESNNLTPERTNWHALEVYSLFSS